MGYANVFHLKINLFLSSVSHRPVILKPCGQGRGRGFAKSPYYYILTKPHVAVGAFAKEPKQVRNSNKDQK